jgi:hypothetical protein
MWCFRNAAHHCGVIPADEPELSCRDGFQTCPYLIEFLR